MKKTGIIVALVAFFVLALLFFEQVAQKAVSSNHTESFALSAEDNPTESMDGSAIYQQKCVACHQSDGRGIAGTFPPLKGSDFLKTAPKKRIIEQVLNGSGGGLLVNGVKYHSPMPAQTADVNEAVAVVNYILNAWGNHYGKVTPEDARGIKKSNKNGRHMMMRGGMGGMGGCSGMRR